MIRIDSNQYYRLCITACSLMDAVVELAQQHFIPRKKWIDEKRKAVIQRTTLKGQIVQKESRILHLELETKRLLSE